MSGERSRPERHHREELIVGEMRPCVVLLKGANVADRQHVGIGKMPRPAVWRPAIEPRKLFLEWPPAIPKIIADAPLIGVQFNVFTLANRCGAGGG